MYLCDLFLTTCDNFISPSGMFQRLDKMRKQAFASVCLFGSDNDSSISGIWVWRGQELAFTVRIEDDDVCVCSMTRSFPFCSSAPIGKLITSLTIGRS